MEITTERLLLRPWKSEDAPVLYEMAKEPIIGEMCGFPPHTSAEDSADVIAHLLQGPYCFAITDKETENILGSVELMLNPRVQLKDGKKESELGFWIGCPYWGHGFAPEAGQALLELAFNHLQMDRVWCGRLLRNHNSAAVQKKLGFYPCIHSGITPPEGHVINWMDCDHWLQQAPASAAILHLAMEIPSDQYQKE